MEKNQNLFDFENCFEGAFLDIQTKRMHHARSNLVQFKTFVGLRSHHCTAFPAKKGAAPFLLGKTTLVCMSRARTQAIRDGLLSSLAGVIIVEITALN